MMSVRDRMRAQKIASLRRKGIKLGTWQTPRSRWLVNVTPYSFRTVDSGLSLNGLGRWQPQSKRKMLTPMQAILALSLVGAWR